MPPIHDGSTVNRHQITSGENARPWYAVNDFVIDGHADVGREAVVAEERRGSALTADRFSRNIVQGCGRHTCRNRIPDSGQRMSHNKSRDPHGFQLTRCFDFNTVTATKHQSGVHGGKNSGGHLVDRPHPIDLHEESLFAVDGNERCRLLEVHLESTSNHLCRVVDSALVLSTLE